MLVTTEEQEMRNDVRLFTSVSAILTATAAVFGLNKLCTPITYKTTTESVTSCLCIVFMHNSYCYIQYTSIHKLELLSLTRVTEVKSVSDII